MIKQRKYPSIWLLLLPSFLLFGSICQAKTWQVAQDGSAAYSIIQDAVDAAASGDTILIGPGNYYDRHLVTVPGWTHYVDVVIGQNELTLIGSGPETVIGREEPWEQVQGSTKGIAISDGWGNHIVRIHNLQIENVRDGIYTSYEDNETNSVLIQDCSFFGVNVSAFLLSNGLGSSVLINCIFDRMAGNQIYVAANSQLYFEMRECTFNDIVFGVIPHLALWANQNSLIKNCHFNNGGVACSIAFGGPALFEGCTFDGQSNVALSPSILSNIIVDNCLFKNQHIVLSSNQFDNSIVFKNSIIEDASEAAFKVWFTGHLRVTNCDLAGGELGIVSVHDQHSCTTPATLDFSGNYWGTADPDSIQNLIWDRYDSEDACFWINYEPFEDVSTPVVQKSMGGFKAMFR